MNPETELKKLCSEHGAEFSWPNEGKVFGGGITFRATYGENYVDWWPFSQNRTAYTPSTGEVLHGATAKDVIRMATAE